MESLLTTLTLADAVHKGGPGSGPQPGGGSGGGSKGNEGKGAPSSKAITSLRSEAIRATTDSFRVHNSTPAQLDQKISQLKGLLSRANSIDQHASSSSGRGRDFQRAIQGNKSVILNLEGKIRSYEHSRKEIQAGRQG